MSNSTPPTAFASWDSAAGLWWPVDPQSDGLFAPLEPLSGSWPTSGMTRRGTAYALPTSEPATTDSASSSSPGLLPTPLNSDAGPRGGTTGFGLRDWSRSLLPTPTTADGAGGPNSSGRDGGDNLRTAAALLPTPRATDGEKGGPNQRGSSGDLMLPSAVQTLLPTPTATPYGNNQSPSPGAAVRPSLDSLASMLLPTPNASDAQGGPKTLPERRTSAGPDFGPRLRDVAPTLLPTPTAMDSHASGGNNPSNVTLTDAVVRTSLGASTNPRFADGGRSSDE
jgi:hypothetical protein